MPQHFARYSRRQFLQHVGASALLTSLVAARISNPAARSQNPNIIFIMADDLGYGDLGCFGSTKIHTPNIDRLAVEGTRFTQAYAGSPVCAPSRCVLMTGLHTGHARIRDNSPGVGGQLEAFDDGKDRGMRLSLSEEDFTVAELLKTAGYTTGIAGKWGLAEPGTDGTPNRQGFDEWLGYLNQNHAPYYYTDYLDENEGRREIPENADGARVVYSNDLFADFTSQFINRHHERPFFLYLPYTIPHNNMEVPDLGVYADEDWPEDAKIYAAMITRLDGYVGRLMRELDAHGLAENTVIFFTSDNGPLQKERADILESAGGLRGAKSTLYEGGIKIPMIVRWPGRVPAGHVSAEPWMFADFMPTCAALAGLPEPTGLDGTSVLPILTDQGATLDQRTFYWEFPHPSLQQAVRRGNWKAIRQGPSQALELYDLSRDPAEQINLASDRPDLVAEFEAAMTAAHTPSPFWPDPRPARPATKN